MGSLPRRYYSRSHPCKKKKKKKKLRVAAMFKLWYETFDATICRNIESKIKSLERKALLIGRLALRILILLRRGLCRGSLDTDLARRLRFLPNLNLSKTEYIHSVLRFVSGNS